MLTEATAATVLSPIAGMEAVHYAALAARARAASAAGIARRHGQYLHADGFKFTRKLGRHTVTVGIAGAYDAFGLIGPEHNGLFVTDETARRVLTDRVEPQTTGYHGPSAAQIALFEQVRGMKAAAFRQWLAGTERFRGHTP